MTDMTWQPIETAPKDGTEILLAIRWESSPVVGMWQAPRGAWVALDTCLMVEAGWDGGFIRSDIDQRCVMFWAPLPAMPDWMDLV